MVQTSVHCRRRRPDCRLARAAACACELPTPFAFDMAPPMDNRDKFVAWGVAQRGEDPKSLRMTSNIDVKLGERVLEIGTGSGYQSAYLAHLTNQALRAAGVALPPTVRDAAAS